MSFESGFVLESDAHVANDHSAAWCAGRTPFGNGDLGTPRAANDSCADGDGVDNPAFGGDDCNDDDPTIHPGATDTCGDGIDSDCDGFGGPGQAEDEGCVAPPDEDCGCRASAPHTGWLWLPALALLAWRRRHDTRPAG